MHRVACQFKTIVARAKNEEISVEMATLLVVCDGAIGRQEAIAFYLRLFFINLESLIGF